VVVWSFEEVGIDRYPFSSSGIHHLWMLWAFKEVWPEVIKKTALAQQAKAALYKTY
jgi:hypothetical protein